MVCTPYHPLDRVTGLRRRYGYGSLQPKRALGRAIESSRPDLIIAGDDLAVDHLLALRNDPDERPADLIDRSLGSPGAFQVLHSRTELIRVARSEGVLAPETSAVSTADDLAGWLTRHGAPAFLKLDGTHGGNGVLALNNIADARALFAKITAPPSLVDIAKETLKQQVLEKARLRLGLSRPSVSVQKAIAGHPANCAFFCWNGEILAHVGVEVLQTTRPLGFATVVRVSGHPMMREASVRIARRLKLTGLYGLDFMIEESSGKAWLIEMNARPTPISHLRLGPGQDLPGAMVVALGGRPSKSDPPPPPGSLIALFPHALKGTKPPRDSLQDVPWDQPALVRASLPATGLTFPRFGEAVGRLLL